ncbi:nucleotide-diphospho-sugar transferase [Wallemia mellicola]|nr:nucleotide-diphospho-sugar transferase [Wallemia mellicola]TIC57812.1 nucleotide-diphospho-sugar transferase [Wallemia mellicola]
MSRSWVTVVTTSTYIIGAKVLNASLKQSGTKYPLLVLTTDALSDAEQQECRDAGMEVKLIEPLLLDTVAAGDFRAAFAEAGNKLRAFALVDYDRLAFLDADTLVCRNIDWLLDTADLIDDDELAISLACTCNNRKKSFYPASWTPENCGHNNITYRHSIPLTKLTDDNVAVNSGVMVFKPSTHLVQTYVFPDQQILQDVFRQRIRILPWKFNSLKVLRVCHKNLWYNDESNRDVHIVHYIHEKPWNKRCKSVAYPNNLPDWHEVDVDPTHAWWWHTHDNYL